MWSPIVCRKFIWLIAFGQIERCPGVCFAKWKGEGHWRCGLGFADKEVRKMMWKMVETTSDFVATTSDFVEIKSEVVAICRKELGRGWCANSERGGCAGVNAKFGKRCANMALRARVQDFSLCENCIACVFGCIIVCGIVSCVWRQFRFAFTGAGVCGRDARWKKTDEIALFKGICRKRVVRYALCWKRFARQRSMPFFTVWMALSWFYDETFSVKANLVWFHA